MTTTATRTARPTYDVVISHSVKDSGLAALVRQAFSDAGLSVFDLHEFPAGHAGLEVLRESLVDSTAVVILATRNSIHSQNLAFEVGAAMAWNKPVFVLYDGVSPDELPGFLRNWTVSRLEDLSAVVDNVSQSRRRLSDDEQQVLADLYEEFEMPTDRLLVSPASLNALTARFNELRGTHLPSERLAHELVRMRKQGRLPRLRRTSTRN